MTVQMGASSSTPRSLLVGGRPVVVASNTAGPSGDIDSGHRVLVFEELGPAFGIDAAFFLIGGSTDLADQVHLELLRVFRSGQAQAFHGPGAPAVYLTTLLERLEGLVDRVHQPLEVAAALWHNEEMSLGAVGRSVIDVKGPQGDVPVLFEHEAEPGGAAIRVGNVPLRDGTTVILGDAEVERFVREEDLRGIQRSTATTERMVSTLTSIAARRGGRVASALVIQIGTALPNPLNARGSGLAPASRPAGARRLTFRVLCVSGVLLILSFILTRVISSPSTSGVPTDLRATQTGRATMQLAWTHVQHASRYIVQIEHRTFRVHAPHLVITGLLVPGHRYRWSVWARIAQAAEPPSNTSTLLMSPRPARHWRFSHSNALVGHVRLRLRHSTTSTVTATISVNGAKPRNVWIPANATVQFAVPSASAARSRWTLSIHANAPILAQLITNVGGASHSIYGVPGIFRVGDALPLPTVPHAFVIFMENKDPGQIINQPDAPYINSLIKKYGYAANYYGVTHPSLPNYIASIAGDFSNAYNDWNGNRFGLRNLADQLEAHHMTWKAYMGGLPYAGYNGDQYPPGSLALYARKHNPFMMMNDILRSPVRRRNSVPEAELFRDLKSGKVPALSFISPNLCEDMHGIDAPHSPCPAVDRQLVRTGDSYLAKLIPQITASSAWKADSTIFIVWDEAEVSIKGCCGDPKGDGGGRVPAIAIARSGSRHLTSHVPYNHYSLLKTLETVWRLGCLKTTCDSTRVKDMTEFLHRTP